VTLDLVSEKQPARPLPVTVAGWLVIGASVVVVLTAFDTVAGLRSLDTREAVEKYLSEPPGDGLGIGLQDALSAMRVLATMAAAFAATTAVLGYQVLRRSRAARVALTALAVPLFLAGLVSGGVASAVVLAAAVMLWFEPARGWFDGRAGPAPSPPSAPPAPAAPAAPAAAAPPALAASAAPAVGPVAARPAALVWACALTWAFTFLAFLALGLSVVLVLASPGLVLDEVARQNPELARQGITESVLRTTVVATAVVGMAWAVFAAVCAGLAWRRVRWARLGLLGSACLTGAVCLAGAVTNVVMLVPLIATTATAVLLLRSDVAAWFAVGRGTPGADEGPGDGHGVMRP
jgi:hypothetical protein